MKYAHPFPARMGPDLVSRRIAKLPRGYTVLDPMMGSGTVLAVASEKGLNACGFDLDPIAILMSKVSTSKINWDSYLSWAEYVKDAAEEMSDEEVCLPWIDDCEETSKYVDYWFAEKQKKALRKLAYVLRYDEEIEKRPKIKDALLLAMSRLIITKKPRASLAADTPRSRPHKIKDFVNDFDVIENYEQSAKKIANLLMGRKITGKVKIHKGDARDMKKIASNSVDAIISSPPYLNAIDYMRGHKMSLVWMGKSIPELRTIRTSSVGAENSIVIGGENADMVDEIYNQLAGMDKLPRSTQNMVKHYIYDMINVLKEAYRVLKHGRKAVYVVGDSCLKEVLIKNSDILKGAAKMAGFRVKSNKERKIPINSRSLPFLKKNKDKGNSLNKRMRYERVITLEK